MWTAFQLNGSMMDANLYPQVPSTHTINVVRPPGVTSVAARSDGMFVCHGTSHTCIGYKTRWTMHIVWVYCSSKGQCCQIPVFFWAVNWSWNLMVICISCQFYPMTHCTLYLMVILHPHGCTVPVRVCVCMFCVSSLRWQSHVIQSCTMWECVCIENTTCKQCFYIFKINCCLLLRSFVLFRVVMESAAGVTLSMHSLVIPVF